MKRLLLSTALALSLSTNSVQGSEVGEQQEEASAAMELSSVQIRHLNDQIVTSCERTLTLDMNHLRDRYEIYQWANERCYKEAIRKRYSVILGDAFVYTPIGSELKPSFQIGNKWNIGFGGRGILIRIPFE